MNVVSIMSIYRESTSESEIENSQSCTIKRRRVLNLSCSVDYQHKKKMKTGSVDKEIGRSTINFLRCRFTGNYGGSLFYVHYNSGLLFSHCTFSNHSLAADPLMVLSDSVLEINNSSFVNNTQHKEGGIAIAKTVSVVKVTSSYFAHNRLSKGSAFYLSRITFVRYQLYVPEQFCWRRGHCVFLGQQCYLYQHDCSKYHRHRIWGSCDDPEFQNHRAKM